MTHLLVTVVQVFSGDEACQNLDHEEFLFLVQSLPWVGLVEKKIEEGWIFLSQRGSPSVPGSSRPRSQVQRCG